ncbi:MAG: hypothetical protein QM706_02275 [Nitrospira sp.]
MDHVGSLVRIMEAEEHHLLKIRMDEADSNAQRRNQLMLITMLVFYVALSRLIWLYRRSHERMRTDMVRYTQELEVQQEELKQQQEKLKRTARGIQGLQ